MVCLVSYFLYHKLLNVQLKEVKSSASFRGMEVPNEQGRWREVFLFGMDAFILCVRKDMGIVSTSLGSLICLRWTWRYF